MRIQTRIKLTHHGNWTLVFSRQASDLTHSTAQTDKQFINYQLFTLHTSQNLTLPWAWDSWCELKSLSSASDLLSPVIVTLGFPSATLQTECIHCNAWFRKQYPNHISPRYRWNIECSNSNRCLVCVQVHAPNILSIWKKRKTNIKWMTQNTTY